MKRINCCFALLVIITLPGIAFGQSPKDAFKALKKLEAKCQSGISYSDYGLAVGDAKFEFNMFLEGEEAKIKPELGESFKKVMKHYQFAKEIWEIKRLERSQFLTIRVSKPTATFRESQQNREKMAEKIFNLYPEAIKDYKAGGAVFEESGLMGIHLDSLISLIWAEASKELSVVSKLLPK